MCRLQNIALESVTEKCDRRRDRWTNRIYHHTLEGTRESHPSVHGLQSTTRLAESWMLQIMDTRIGFTCPFHNVVIDYFSLTHFIFNK